LTTQEPVRSKIYPTPYKLQEVIENELQSMLAMDVIEVSTAPYVAPLVIVKKPDGSNRVCVNYKDLNKVTVFDPEPMMNADEIFPKLSGSHFFSKFDMSRGYWSVPVHPDSRDYTTFICQKVLFKFKVLPFGLVNSGSTFNRCVRKLLKGTQNLENYLDGVLAHTGDWSYHVTLLRDFFERVRQANLALRPSKCAIGYQENIQFWGHTLGIDTLRPRSDSVEKIGLSADTLSDTGIVANYTKALQLWFMNNRMMLNPNKSEAMICGTWQWRSRSQLPLSVKVAGVDIAVADHTATWCDS
jgi:hypothetical protein